MFDGYKITEKKSFSLNYKEKIALKEGEDDENCASSSAFSNFNAIIAPSCSHRLDNDNHDAHYDRECSE
jgi:hypothetical protein